MFSLKTRKDKLQIIAVGVASFMAIFPLCAWRHLDIIENDLLERAAESLEAGNISGIEIEISGRDLEIYGTTSPADMTQAQQLLSQVRGVRKVTMPDTPSLQAPES